jgi:hypothetical protein
MKTLVFLQFGAPLVIFALGMLGGVISLKKAVLTTFSILGAFVGVTLWGGLSPVQYFFFGIGILLFLPAVVTLLSLVEKKGPSPIDSAVGVYSSLSPEEKEMAKRAGGKVLRGLLAVASGHFRKKGHTGLASAAEQFLK